jgi:hypothetical protein
LAPNFTPSLMICGFVIKSSKGEKKLLLSREGQKRLSRWLWHTIGDHSFVFNTTEGLYLFLAEGHCTTLMQHQLDTYLSENARGAYVLRNCSNQSHFFLQEVGDVLQDNASSDFAWKNFISSFLGQLKPFVGDSRCIGSFSKNFVGIVKFKGDKAQLDYLKRKMNLLRERVDIGVLFEV